MTDRQPPAPSRGLFICLEGLDRTGKSTQCDRLVSRLSQATGRPVVLQKFPDRTTPIGKLISAYLTKQAGGDLSDESVHLLFSGNRWEKRAEILRLLESGTHVVLDRYILSGIAFTVAKGLPFDWCKAPDVGLPWPDATIVLELDPSEAQQRGGFGNERYEVPKMQAEVAKVFGKMGGIKVSASGTIEEVGERIWGVVQDLLDKAPGEIAVFE